MGAADLVARTYRDELSGLDGPSARLFLFQHNEWSIPRWNCPILPSSDLCRKERCTGLAPIISRRWLSIGRRLDGAPTGDLEQTRSRGVRMKKQDFDRLSANIRQAGAIRRGEIKPSRVAEFPSTNVKAIRQELGKSQSEFAQMIGVGVSTLQNWEQGRRRPRGPARALLMIAARDPKAVAAALDPKRQQ